jgi:hypothetical protein
MPPQSQAFAELEVVNPTAPIIVTLIANAIMLLIATARLFRSSHLITVNDSHAINYRVGPLTNLALGGHPLAASNVRFRG